MKFLIKVEYLLNIWEKFPDTFLHYYLWKYLVQK